MGPTQLEVDAEVDYEGGVAADPQKDAVRKLMNRAKFGADSIMYFPFAYGAVKGVGNIAKYGNTTAATITLCLADWEDRLNKNDNLILAAFGGGFTWGSVLLQY